MMMMSAQQGPTREEAANATLRKLSFRPSILRQDWFIQLPQHCLHDMLLGGFANLLRMDNKMAG